MANLTILSQDVRVQDGLYSLNDLHKAAGMIKKNQPANFMRLESTIGLIDEINNSSDLRSIVGLQKYPEANSSKNAEMPAYKKVQGRNGGSWVCKELVYAYAMWISPSFHLKVIRAFDQAQNIEPEQLPLPPASAPDESEKFQLLNNIVSSMDFKQPVVVIPTQEVSDMIAAIRMYQAQIARLQTPDWVEGNIANVKRSTNRNFADI